MSGVEGDRGIHVADQVVLRGRRLHVHAVAANCLFPYLDTVAYQLLMSPISVSGYATELVRSRRVW